MEQETIAGAELGNGAAPIAPAVPENDQPATNDKGDYLARVRNEPDFAEEQIRAKDRLISELRAKGSRFADLDPFLDKLGGPSGVQQHLVRSLRLETAPAALREMWDHWERTGQLPAQATAPAPGQEEDDPYLDPSVKALRDQMKDQNDRMAQLQARLDRAEGRVTRTDIDGHLKKLEGEYPEVYAETLPIVYQRIGEMERDPRGREMLQNMTYDALELVFLKAMKSKLRDIGKMRYEAEIKATNARTTDSPTRVATNGRETRPAPRSVREALEANAREMGISLG